MAGCGSVASAALVSAYAPTSADAAPPPDAWTGNPDTLAAAGRIVGPIDSPSGTP